MQNRQVYYFALILVIVALAVFSYKVLLVGYPIRPGEPVQAWDVEAKVEFEALGTSTKLTIFLPGDRVDQRVFDFRFVAPGFGSGIETSGANRQVVLATRKASGRQTIHVSFVVHRFSTLALGAREAKPVPDKVALEGAPLAAAKALATAAHERSSDDRTFITALLRATLSDAFADSVKQLAGRKQELSDRIDAAVTVAAMQNIAARRVNGIDLSGSRKRTPVVRWLEAYIGDKWVGFDPETGEARVPDSRLAWWYGRKPLLAVEGGSAPFRTLSFTRLDEKLLERLLAEGKERSNQSVTLSLFGLPLATQDVYRLLMVVPIGIFILVIIRNVIGLRTLGTFMPVLIALAFRETQLVWGVILFTSVVGAGLLFRGYLEHLKLLLVPRLASVLIFVVLFMAVMSVVTNQLGFQSGLSVALFPMVIMTMAIERISVIWDELGAHAALKQAFGSLVIAILCYIVMSQALVEYLFFTFPELLLILLAGTLLLGRYSGYRLLEISRFKILARDDR